MEVKLLIKQEDYNMGGEAAPSNTNNIQYITIASTGNSTSFGELFQQPQQYFNGCSNGHGGLS